MMNPEAPFKYRYRVVVKTDDNDWHEELFLTKEFALAYYRELVDKLRSAAIIALKTNEVLDTTGEWY